MATIRRILSGRARRNSRTSSALMVRNRSERLVLFLEGQELKGAKQNRILNSSVLIAAGNDARIPVSCVEQGRWHYRSRHFGSTGHYASPKLRTVLRSSVYD